MKKFLLILFLIASLIGVAQTGGRHREGKNQKRLHHRITKKWKYRSTPGWKNKDKSLFHWNVTKGKRSRNKMQLRINTERARRRIHGNDVFAKRKYKRV